MRRMEEAARATAFGGEATGERVFGKKRIEELERQNRDLRGQVLKIAPLENQIRELDERLAELGALEHAERERQLRELERASRPIDAVPSASRETTRPRRGP